MIKTLLLSLFLLCTTPAMAQEYYKSFAPIHCCYTNNCCFEIKSTDVEDLGNGRYRIRASNQEVNRTDFSPDGKYHRCSCEQKLGEDNKVRWTKFPTANTRCLFTPRFGS